MVCAWGVLYINITLLGIYVVTVHKWPTSGCGDVPLLGPRPPLLHHSCLSPSYPTSFPAICSSMTQLTSEKRLRQLLPVWTLPPHSGSPSSGYRSLSPPWQDRHVQSLRTHPRRGRKPRPSGCLKLPPNSFIFPLNWPHFPLELIFVYYSFVIWRIHSLKQPCTSLAKTDKCQLLRYVLDSFWADKKTIFLFLSILTLWVFSLTPAWMSKSHRWAAAERAGTPGKGGGKGPPGRRQRVCFMRVARWEAIAGQDAGRCWLGSRVHFIKGIFAGKVLTRCPRSLWGMVSRDWCVLLLWSRWKRVWNAQEAGSWTREGALLPDWPGLSWFQQLWGGLTFRVFLAHLPKWHPSPLGTCTAPGFNGSCPAPPSRCSGMLLFLVYCFVF